MGYKNVSSIWNFVPYFLYWVATSFHEAPFTKLWCPGKRSSRQILSWIVQKPVNANPGLKGKRSILVQKCFLLLMFCVV